MGNEEKSTESITYDLQQIFNISIPCYIIDSDFNLIEANEKPLISSRSLSAANPACSSLRHY